MASMEKTLQSGGLAQPLPALQETTGFKPAILIVEDDPNDLELYRRFVTSDSYLKDFRLLTASDSQEATKIFRENRGSIVAVTTDRAMEFPDAGDRVVREIRKIELEAGAVDPTNRGVGIAMISGTLPQKQSELDSIGADKYLEKPVSFGIFRAEFQRTVKEMIVRTHQRRPDLLKQ
jgi:CheY-like chemotaxis protein